MRGRKMSYQRKKAWTGFWFISPWLLGFIFLFARPMCHSLVYSFHKLQIRPSGLEMTFIGLDNYRRAFLQDPQFVRQLTESITGMLYQVPIIVIFSLFIAYVINQDFFGRTLVRAIFFLPVIIASGVVMDILRGDALAQALLTGQKASSLFEVTALQNILLESGLPQEIVSLFLRVVNDIFELSWKSGIQILVFLAGLQTIPRSLYEAAAVEGATGWESFWKITFPMISPMILLNLIYTIIDNFTDYSNTLMVTIARLAADLQIAYSSTLAWIYFIIVFCIIGVTYKIVDKRVFYMT